MRQCVFSVLEVGPALRPLAKGRGLASHCNWVLSGLGFLIQTSGDVAVEFRSKLEDKKDTAHFFLFCCYLSLMYKVLVWSLSPSSLVSGGAVWT